MRQTSFAGMHCSLARTLDVVGDWWTPLILRDVYLGVDRFTDLAEDLGLSRNLLTERLAGLVSSGILLRRRYQERPPRDRYALTEAGRELIPVLVALTAWGDRWQTPEGGPPIRFQHGGHLAAPIVACGECGDPITSESLAARPGPGGRRAPGTMLIAERLATGLRRQGAEGSGETPATGPPDNEAADFRWSARTGYAPARATP